MLYLVKLLAGQSCQSTALSASYKRLCQAVTEACWGENTSAVMYIGSLGFNLCCGPLIQELLLFFN